MWLKKLNLKLFCLGAFCVLSGCAGEKPSLQQNRFFPGTSGLISPSSDQIIGSPSSAATPAVNPFDPIALNNLAVAEVNLGRYQQALTLLQRAARLAPARADIALNLSNLERWMELAAQQATMGLAPKALQMPRPESAPPDLPPLWQSTAPQGSGNGTAPVLVPRSGAGVPSSGGDSTRKLPMRGI